MKIKKLLTCFVLCSLFASCITDVNIEDINADMTLGTSLALPIGSVHANMMNLLDIVDSTYVTSDSTNAICLLYEQNNINLELNLDTSFRKGEYLKETLTLRTRPCFQELFSVLPSNIKSIPLPIGVYEFNVDTVYNLDFNRIKEDEITQIDWARIYKANIDFIVKVEGIELSEENFLIMSLHYPCLLDEEYDHLFEDITITTNNFSMKEAMNNFIAYFEELDGNFIDLEIDFKLVSSGTTTISRDAKLTFETEINLINTHEVHGFVWYKDPIDAGKITYDIPQDIFQNELLVNNKLLFANPEVTIKATTNVGLPLRLELTDVYATKGDRIEYALFNGQDNAIQNLNIPTEAYDSATTTITINREYGSLHTLLSMLPETINLDYKVTTPQKTKTKIGEQFLTIPPLARLDIQAKLPFQFDPTTSFTYKDTLDANLSELLGSSLEIINIDTICIYLDVNSSLPVNASLKLGYLNENNDLIMESEHFTINSAEVDQEGRVQTPTTTELALATSSQTIEDVYDTKKIVLEIGVEGYDENSMIYFETTNAIDIKVSAFAKAKAELSLTNNNN